jgi:hypothetical protein
MNTLAELKEELQSKELTVVWSVRCQTGPEWIGSEREICFYLNNQALGNTPMHEMLIDALIKCVNIPATSEVYMIKGEGELRIADNNLVVEYEMEYNIPYDTEIKCESGTGHSNGRPVDLFVQHHTN